MQSQFIIIEIVSLNTTMNLFIDIKTKRNLAVFLRSVPKSVNEISSAIAFTQDSTLIDLCIKNKIKLEWWGLFNAESSTNYEIIKQAIKSSNIRFYPFAEYFHPKIIYFHGYGVYIGSHNMTKSALYDNIEAGVFLNETELTDEQLKEINNFFTFLRSKSIPATIDDIEKIDEFIKASQVDREQQERIQTGLDEYFNEQFSHLFILKRGVEDFGSTKHDSDNKHKHLFLQEWRETQNFLGIVKELMLKNCTQPDWIYKDAETTIITDQLLHAYYYTYLLKGNEDHKSIEVVNSEYQKHYSTPEKAIIGAIRWWETLKEAPSSEDIHINIWGKSNKNILSYLKERDLTKGELLTVLKQNHAARNHARQIKNKFFSLPESFKTNIEERVVIYSNWLFEQRTVENLTISDAIRYLLFDKQGIEERVYNTINEPKYHFDHFGRSIVGELIGWGRPEITHLRNNRVNKALRCLGYDVRLFSE